MMITGQGSTSLRKQDQENSRIQSVGYTKQKIAHQAVAGATGINLNALTTPPSMAANGFQNPTTSQIASSNLLFYRNNLKIVSSARGVLEDYISYTVAGSTQINFAGFTAAENEIFVLTVDYNAQTGVQVANTTSSPVTATLAAGQTDVNIGQSFPTNKWSTANVGAVKVFKDGVLQHRNTANSSTTLDGNYYEVDSGSGSFSLVRFNTPETYATQIDVVPNGFVIEQGNGSMQSTIEAMNGQMVNMAAYLAAVAGVPVSTLLGGSPSNVDLSAFGNRVLTLEQTRALLGAVNTFTSPQNIPGRTDGSSVPTGDIGEIKLFTTVSVSAISGNWAINSSTPLATLGSGNWLVFGWFYFAATSGLAGVACFIGNSATVATGNINSFTTTGGAAAGTSVAVTGVVLPTPLTVPASTTVSLYANMFCTGAAASTAQMSGFAMRVG